MINDFSIRRQILNMFKISRRIWIIATVSSKGVRTQKRRKTMFYYQLPLQTILKKNAFRMPSQGIFQEIRLGVRGL